MNHRIALTFAALLTLLAANASAGTLAAGNWSPAACGAAPEAAQLDLSSLEAYNRSVDKVNTYHKSMEAYLACMVGEANSDIQLITKTANDAQQAAQRDNEKLIEDAKEAKQKFGN